MNIEQAEAAKNAMIAWLSDPHELGKEPVKMELAGTFSLYDMQYYYFKYKKSLLGKWLLGVCGGYEENALEHCGHVFSEMQNYHADTAKEAAIKMVEMIRSYWIEQAKRIQ